MSTASGAGRLARGGPANAAFGWIAVATLVLLALVLGIPAVSRLFAFVAPTPAMLRPASALALLALLWFEAVKWRLSRGIAIVAETTHGRSHVPRTADNRG